MEKPVTSPALRTTEQLSESGQQHRPKVIESATTNAEAGASPTIRGAPRRRRLWYAVGFVTVLGVTGFGFWRGTTVVTEQVNSGLVIDPAALNFGEAWVDPSFQWTLPLQNRTNRFIEILDLAASCGCTSVEPRSLVLGPGEKKQLTLTLDLTSPTDEGASFPERDFSVRIVPRLKAGGREPRGWFVQGKIRSMFTFSPPVLGLWEGLVRGEPFPTATVLVNAHEPVSIVDVEAEPELADVSFGRVEGDERQFRLQVTPYDSIARGPFSFHIVLWARAGTGERFADRTLRVVGRVVDDVRVIPEALAFGPHPIGSMLKEDVIIRSRSGKDLETVDVHAEGVDLGAVPIVADAPRDAIVVRVSQNVSRLGHQQNALSLSVAYQNGSCTETRVPVTYHGIPIATSKSALDTKDR